MLINNALILHGGPGLSTYLEEKILGPIFSDHGWKSYFWNEPTQFRFINECFDSTNAYENHFLSAKNKLENSFNLYGPVHIIAHSFSTHTALRLMFEAPELIARVSIAGPALNLDKSFHQMFRLAIQDLAITLPEQSKRLEEVLSKNPKVYDENMKQGFLLMVLDETLSDHYWYNQVAASLWKQSLMLKEGQQDGNVFFNVIESFGKSGWFQRMPKNKDIPVQLVFGQKDKIIFKEDEIEQFEKHFSFVRSDIVAGAGHFPQLEAPEQFMDLIFNFAQESVSRRVTTVEQRVIF